VAPLGLSASFSHIDAIPGRPLCRNPGALVTAIDWSQFARHRVSHFISLIEHADVDFGDRSTSSAATQTRAILLYIRGVEEKA
jgi:acetyltransferase